MSEFGHFTATGHGFHLDIWGAGPFTIVDASGKEWFFEDSDRFGPHVLHRKTHAILDRQPGERSPFWRAHTLWVKQGRRVEGQLCRWDEPKPTVIRKLSRTVAVVVENGEEDGLTIEETTP